MSNSRLITSTDPVVATPRPAVTGTTVGAKHGIDVAIISGGSGGGTSTAAETIFNSAFVDWTVDTAAYAVDDQFGDIEAFPVLSANDGSCIIDSIVIIDDDKLKLDLDILIFESLPTLTSVDNGALAMTAANLQLCRARIEVRESDWSDLSGQSIADVIVGKSIRGANGDTNLYAVIQKKVIAATPVATGSVSLALNIRRD